MYLYYYYCYVVLLFGFIVIVFIIIIRFFSPTERAGASCAAQEMDAPQDDSVNTGCDSGNI
jgi:TRAP-type C4-dicarboxylate transport system permease small subunit